jgi:hypothetical protein
MREIPVNYRGYLVCPAKGGLYTIKRITDQRQVGGVYTSPTGARAAIDRLIQATSRV